MRNRSAKLFLRARNLFIYRNFEKATVENKSKGLTMRGRHGESSRSEGHGTRGPGAEPFPPRYRSALLS